MRALVRACVIVYVGIPVECVPRDRTNVPHHLLHMAELANRTILALNGWYSAGSLPAYCWSLGWTIGSAHTNATNSNCVIVVRESVSVFTVFYLRGTYM